MNNASTPRYHIKTYGCQMNVYDSDAIAQVLQAQGWQAANHPQEAEVIILNSCHIRHKAAEKIYSEVGRLRLEKKRNALIAVAGCVAQAEGRAMMERQKDIALVFGPQDFHRLPEMIARAKEGEKVTSLDFHTKEKFIQLKKTPPQQKKVSSFLTIQEGCDKFCSFCVVPYTRGNEVSRAPQDIINEARVLCEQGAKEIVLLGQNVNAYHHQGWDLAGLLEALADEPALKRLRYTTSHPLDMTTRLIDAHRDNPKLMPFLHLPVQSGSDKILKKMNRRHQAKDYRDIVSALREVRPDIALSSDFIVGFPEETDEDFADTLALVEEIKFAQSFSFKYSPRPGTKAASLLQVEEEIKSKRLTALQQVLAQQQADFHQSKVGERLEVLFEEQGKGKTTYGQHTHCKEAELGSTLAVKITRATPYGLEGLLDE